MAVARVGQVQGAVFCFLVCTMGCNPAGPLSEDGEGSDDAAILTPTGHLTGYGLLGCFASGSNCHASAGAGFAPDAEHHNSGDSCVECHGDNGVLTATLVTGRIYSDVAGTFPLADIVVTARDIGGIERFSSEPTDEFGFFSLQVTESGTYDWTLRDESSGGEVHSELRGMPSEALNGGSIDAMDCGGCHGSGDEAPLAFIP